MSTSQFLSKHFSRAVFSNQATLTRRKPLKRASILALSLATGIPALAQSPATLTYGDMTARLGALAQFQFQSNTDPVLAGTSDDFVLRRVRIYAVGTVGDLIEWRLDTDDPNLGKVAGNTNGTKNLNNVYIQDALIPLFFDPGFKLDTGLITVDPSHNAIVGAAKIYGWDAFAYQGLQNTPLQNNNSGTQGSAPLNRDFGLQARGLLFGGHLEYHAGFTNGYRNGANDTNASTGGNTGSGVTVIPGVTSISSNNSLRTTLRAQYNLFDNEGATYTTEGTYFGQKKIVSLSLGYEAQDAYKQRVAEFFVDLPVNGGKDVFTAQGGYWLYDGGTFLPSLLKQKDYSFEMGYNFGKRWNPIIRIEGRRFDTPGDASLGVPLSKTNWVLTPGAFNENRQSIGLDYWYHQHNASFKVFYTNVQPKNEVSASGLDSGFRNYHQIVAQLQLYVF